MLRILINRVVGPALASQHPLAVSFIERGRQQHLSARILTQEQGRNHRLLLLCLSDKLFMSFSVFFESLVLPTAGEATSISSMIARSGASPEEAMLLEEPASVVDIAKEDTRGVELGSDLADDWQVASSWKSLPTQITAQGVTLEPTTELSIADSTKRITLLRNGHGIRTVRAPFGYNLHVYVVTLYTTAPAQSEQDVQDLLFHSAADGGCVMEFTFLRDITPSQMSIAWNYQLDTSVTASDYEAYDQDRAQFLKLLGEGAMPERGVIRFEFWTSGANPKTLITNQGELVGEIEGTNFQKAFASMWFGDHPVMEEIKTGLLQGDGVVQEENFVEDVQVTVEESIHQPREEAVTEPVSLQA
jgi:Chalcone isomerase-like